MRRVTVTKDGDARHVVVSGSLGPLWDYRYPSRTLSKLDEMETRHAAALYDFSMAEVVKAVGV